MILDKSKRHFRRYKEIGRVLAKHGWDWMLYRLGMSEYVGHRLGLKRSAGPAHIREMLEELGPTFVKMGQLLSTRPDIVPESYIVELSKLQDTAPTLPLTSIVRVIESEFGVPIGELYQEFDPNPIAAASLGQVHRARLANGTPVIVKIQRPGIRDIVETDIEIMYGRARFLEDHFDVARVYGLMDIIDEFALTIREELDYSREGRNTDRLREVVSDELHVQVPKVYWSLTTGRVLTLEQMCGIKITDAPTEPDLILDLKDVSQRLASTFLEQIFVHGFFHADPHPGNILLADDGVIQLVDCGQVGRLDPESKAGAVRMLVAYEQQDTRGLAEEIIDLGIAREEVDARQLTRDLGKVLRSYYDLPARAVNMGRLLTRVLSVSAAHKIRLPVSFTVLGKVFTNIDGICRQLDPEFNFTEVIRVHINKAVKNELRSRDTLTDLFRAVVSLRDFAFGLPEQLERLLRRAVEGNLRLEFKHQGLEDVSIAFISAANRISIALIVAGTIVGSSLVVVAGRGPKSWFGLPTLGLVGYIFATFFGVWLIVSILRSSRHK